MTKTFSSHQYYKNCQGQIIVLFIATEIQLKVRNVFEVDKQFW